MTYNGKRLNIHCLGIDRDIIIRVIGGLHHLSNAKDDSSGMYLDDLDSWDGRGARRDAMW